MEMSSEILIRYADLLDYPGGGVTLEPEALLALVAADCPPAAEALADFTRFMADSDRTRMEEAYTATFDLRPVCSPYVGYHLCGEGYQRSRFLVKLQEIYRRYGFAVEGELADHFPAVLRFLARAGDEPEGRELARDGLLPALEKSLAAFEEPSPYGELLRSLQLWLRGDMERPDAQPVVAPQEESVS